VYFDIVPKSITLMQELQGFCVTVQNLFLCLSKGEIS